MASAKPIREKAKPLASPAIYKRTCGDGWEEIREADKAVRAYRRKFGDQAFVAERERLHDAFRAQSKTMKLGDRGYASRKVADAVRQLHQTADNWGVLVLVYCERIAAQQAFDDAFPQTKKAA